MLKILDLEEKKLIIAYFIAKGEKNMMIYLHKYVNGWRQIMIIPSAGRKMQTFLEESYWNIKTHAAENFIAF